MQGRVDLPISGSKGETFAMVLRQHIDSPGLGASKASRTALSKIQKAKKNERYIVRLTQAEAESVLDAVGSYFGDYSWTPQNPEGPNKYSNFMLAERSRPSYPGINYTEED